MNNVAVLLLDHQVDDDVCADTVLLLDPADPSAAVQIARARRVGIAIDRNARLTGGADRDAAIGPLNSAGFTCIVVPSHRHEARP